MSKPFAYHVFAHDGSRYRTISAVGISELESKSLEQFFFGQTNDEDYLGSLESEPGVIWRNLNGRGALTRVRVGQNDSNGRETLRFETILFPGSQRAKASQKLDVLVLSSWEFKEEGAFLSASGESAGEVHPEKISDVSMAVRAGGRVVRRAADFSLTDVAKIVSSCGDSADFSLCFKSLNNTAPVIINLVSLEVPERNMNSSLIKPLQTVPRQAPRETPQGRSVDYWITSAGICAIIAIQLFTVWRGFSPGAMSGDFSTMQNAIQNKDDAIAKEVMRTTAGGLDESTKKIMANTESAFASLNNNVFKELGQLKDNIQSIKETLGSQVSIEENSRKNDFNEITKQLSALKQEVSKIESIRNQLEKQQTDSQQLKSKVEELSTKVAEVTTKVAELKTSLVEIGRDIAKIRDSNRATSQP